MTVPIQLTLYIPPARKSDPKTSKMGERTVARRGPSQKMTLLLEYAKTAPLGLTADEAGQRAGMIEKRIGYWKRVSDLIASNLIVPTGETRPGLSGELQRVHRITDEGLALANQLQDGAYA